MSDAAANFILSLGQNAVSKVLETAVSNARNAAAGRISAEKSILAGNLRSIVQTDFEEIKDKLKSQSEKKLNVAKQSCREAVASKLENFDDSQIGINVDAIKSVPKDCWWKLKNADTMAKEVFYDSANCKTTSQIDAVKVQLFCLLVLSQTDSGRSLSLVALLIKAIGDNVVMKGSLMKVLPSNIGTGKATRKKVVKLYQHIRSGLCSLAELWPNESQKTQKCIDLLNEVHPKNKYEKRLGVDGFILSKIYKGIQVFVMIGSSFRYWQTSDKVTVRSKCYDLSVGLKSFDVEKVKLKRYFLNGNKQNALVGDSWQELTTSKKRVVSKNGNGVSITWVQDGGESTTYVFTTFPPEFQAQFYSEQNENVNDKFLSKRVSLVHVKDRKREDGVSVFLKVSQTLWQIKFSENFGIKLVKKLFDIPFAEPNFIRWSDRLSAFEVVSVVDEKTCEISTISKSNPLQRNFRFQDQFDFMPHCLSSVTEYTFQVNNLFVTEKHVFIALGIQKRQ